MPGNHAIFSPSSAERWLTCPGSVSLTVDMPEDESPYADEGTLAHELFEKMMLDLPFEVDAYPVDMISHVHRAATEALFLVPDGVACLVEQKLKLNDDIHGTGDVVIPEYFGTLTIADLKYGQGVPVGALNEDGTPNYQLMTYAAMASLEHGDDFFQARLVIIQPRVDADLVTDVTVPIEDVIAFREVLLAGVEAAKAPNAPLVPSKKGCRWCKAKAICPALAQSADELIEASVSTVPSLSPEKLAEILNQRDQVEDWLKSVYAYAIKLTEAGVTIPGYSLKPKRAYTRWLPGAEKAAQEAYGQFIFEQKLVSPAQAKKVLTGSKGQAFIEEWTEATSSGMNLVREKTAANLLF